MSSSNCTEIEEQEEFSEEDNADIFAGGEKPLEDYDEEQYEEEEDDEEQEDEEESDDYEDDGEQDQEEDEEEEGFQKQKNTKQSAQLKSQSSRKKINQQPENLEIIEAPPNQNNNAKAITSKKLPEGADMLEYLRGLKAKASEAGKQDSKFQSEIQNNYKDSLTKKVGVITHVETINDQETLRKYYCLCRMTKYEIPRVVMYCKQYYESTNKKVDLKTIQIQRFWDDCTSQERVVHRIGLKLFQNWKQVEAELELFYQWD